MFVAPGEQLSPTVTVLPVLGPDSMNDPSTWHVTGTRGNGITSGEPIREGRPPQRAAFVENLGAAGLVNRTIDSAPAEQGAPRCINDGVACLEGDVAPDSLDGRLRQRRVISTILGRTSNR